MKKKPLSEENVRPVAKFNIPAALLTLCMSVLTGGMATLLTIGTGTLLLQVVGPAVAFIVPMVWMAGSLLPDWKPETKKKLLFTGGVLLAIAMIAGAIGLSFIPGVGIMSAFVLGPLIIAEMFLSKVSKTLPEANSAESLGADTGKVELTATPLLQAGTAQVVTPAMNAKEERLDLTDDAIMDVSAVQEALAKPMEAGGGNTASLARSPESVALTVKGLGQCPQSVSKPVPVAPESASFLHNLSVFKKSSAFSNNVELSPLLPNTEACMDNGAPKPLIVSAS